MSDYSLVAEIKSVYKKDGFVSLIPHANFPETILNLKKIYVEVFGGYKEFFVEKTDIVKNNFILKLKNFNSEDEVLFLLGKKIYIISEDKSELDKDEFFVHDLIGSEVFRNDERFGKITDVLSLPANDVYVIDDCDGNEILIPAVKDYVESFDPVKKKLILKPGGSIYDDED